MCRLPKSLFCGATWTLEPRSGCESGSGRCTVTGRIHQDDPGLRRDRPTSDIDENPLLKSQVGARDRLLSIEAEGDRREHHAGRLPGPEGPRQDQPCDNRLFHLSPALLGERELPLGLLAHCDHASVRGQPHRLCSHQRHSRGCAQHLLLDTLHIHYPQCILEAHRDRRGTPRNRQNHRPRRKKICQVLPVGLLLSLLPGKKDSFWHPHKNILEKSSPLFLLQLASQPFDQVIIEPFWPVTNGWHLCRSSSLSSRDLERKLVCYAAPRPLVPFRPSLDRVSSPPELSGEGKKNILTNYYTQDQRTCSGQADLVRK